MIPDDDRTRMLKLIASVTRETSDEEAERVRHEWHKFKTRVIELWATSPEECKWLLGRIYQTAEFRDWKVERHRRTQLTPTFKKKKNSRARGKYKRDPQVAEKKREQVRLSYWRAKGVEAPPPKRKYERGQP